MKVTALQRQPLLRINVSVDEHTVRVAHKHGINVSHVCREAIGLAVKAAVTKRTQTLQMEP